MSNIEITQICLKIREKSNIAQFFLVCLLVLLANYSHFWLGDSVDLTLSLTVEVVIDSVVLIGGEVTVGLSGWSVENVLISFLSC